MQIWRAYLLIGLLRFFAYCISSCYLYIYCSLFYLCNYFCIINSKLDCCNRLSRSTSLCQIHFPLSILNYCFDVTFRKYKEICSPHVEEFCYIIDNTYTREEVQFSFCIARWFVTSLLDGILKMRIILILILIGVRNGDWCPNLLAIWSDNTNN